MIDSSEKLSSEKMADKKPKTETLYVNFNTKNT